MNRLKNRIFRAGLDIMYTSGVHSLLAPVASGRGVIFTLHHVKQGPTEGFSPNHILEITPEFLEMVVTRVRWAGFDIVSLDEAAERLADETAPPFAVLTFDDGYRDNLDVAYPILKRLDAPFCVYVATGLPDGTADLWWLTLEEIIRGADRISCRLDDDEIDMAIDDDDEKLLAFEKIYWWLRDCGEDRQRSFIRNLAENHDVDLVDLCRRLSMTWDEIIELSRDPLVTIGAHTRGHYALAKIDADRAWAEMEESARIIEGYLGAWPEHFSFPYGDPGSADLREFDMARRIGFKTAVTTRPGVLFDQHAGSLTALPRVSLNGAFQEERYVDLFLTGAPFALFNMVQRLRAA